jgi:cobalt-zinc-cadmium resistance protein CzcA
MLNKIIQCSIQHKLLIGLLTGGIIIWGIWSAGKLPVDAVPDITNNQVQIITLTPTLAAQETEQLVTYIYFARQLINEKTERSGRKDPQR